MIDSLNFLPFPLRDFTKAFDLKETKKGFFPYMFNTPENQNYKGPLPNKKYFDPEGMKEPVRQEFMKWYHKQPLDLVYDLKKELTDYCISDVNLLREGCISFFNLFQECTGVDPFERCITIASVCMLVYRKLFLKPHTIGIIPKGGYTPYANQSKKAIGWLRWVAQEQGVHIIHDQNGGEKVFRLRDGRRVPVDGYCQSTNTIYQFHGCLWHGCPKCYKPETDHPFFKGKSMSDTYAQTVQKTELLEENCTVIEFWECEFEELRKENPEFVEFLDTVDFQEALNPRSAFFGGRTNCVKHYYKAGEGEKVLYMDITSLYPFINKYRPYPIKHPDIITEDFKTGEGGEYDIGEYFGLIKCKVSPPRGLYHPVLPYKCLKKLMFPLCRTCAETTQQAPCNHTTESRALVATWVTEEVKEAIKKGYKIEKIYEVWHYPQQMKYDPQQNSEGLFSGYVNNFLKIKQEASGWPYWVKTEEDKVKYIESYYEREKIHLDRTKIQKNPGLRTIGKAALNNFWGRLGIREQFSQCEYIKEPRRFFDLLLADSIELTDFQFVSEGMVMVNYKQRVEFISENPEASVVHAAFTTAHARLYLYEALEKLGERVLYYDTDSVIFVQSTPEQWHPPMSDFLGDYTDELDGRHIVTFASGGPKNYCYALNDGSSVVKVKGITLNHRSSQQINLETIVDMVTHPQDDRIIETIEPFKITRDPKQRKITSKKMTKKYRFKYDKRAMTENYDTLPFGY